MFYVTQKLYKMLRSIQLHDPLITLNSVFLELFETNVSYVSDF